LPWKNGAAAATPMSRAINLKERRASGCRSIKRFYVFLVGGAPIKLNKLVGRSIDLM
jgi:hypothetical protein